MLKMGATQAEKGAVHPLVNCIVWPSVSKRKFGYPSKSVGSLNERGRVVGLHNNSWFDVFLLASDKVVVSDDGFLSVLFFAWVNQSHARISVS